MVSLNILIIFLSVYSPVSAILKIMTQVHVVLLLLCLLKYRTKQLNDQFILYYVYGYFCATEKTLKNKFCTNYTMDRFLFKVTKIYRAHL